MKLKDALKKKKFVVTSEVQSPIDQEPEDLVRSLSNVRGRVDGVSLSEVRLDRHRHRPEGPVPGRSHYHHRRRRKTQAVSRLSKIEIIRAARYELRVKQLKFRIPRNTQLATRNSQKEPLPWKPSP